MRIALAQINSILGDFEKNRSRILHAIKNAEKQQADIVVFPELALCGYPPEDLLFKRQFIRDAERHLSLLVKEVADVVAIVGCLDVDKDGNVFNAAAIIGKKKIQGVYRKQILPNYGVFDEKRHFSSGNHNGVFAIGDYPCGISICEDIWGEALPCKEQYVAGARLLLNISASPFHAGKRNARKRMLQKHAQQMGVAVGYVNAVGGQDELVFDGGSFVFDATGAVVVAAKHLEEDLVVCDIPRTKQRIVKQNARVSRVSVPCVIAPKTVVVHPCKIKPLSLVEEVYRALVLGTRDYVRKNGFQKVLIGLSGGIDSALVAAIAVDALGSENVVGLSMPSCYSSQTTKRDAQKLAHNLNICFHEIPIVSVMQAYDLSLADIFSDTLPNEAEENIQARIRGNLLMALSNKFGWLVLTTGNKSETAVGYCTLYGDMAGGFAVIKDVYKTLVYRLSEYRNSLQRTNIIPRTILTRAPSAELRPGQKDQDSLPPYDLLDAILKEYVENDCSVRQIIRRRGHADIVRNVVRLVDRNEYKRRQAPPGIKITPKSFGRDRRLPITNRYNG